MFPTTLRLFNNTIHLDETNVRRGIDVQISISSNFKLVFEIRTQIRNSIFQLHHSCIKYKPSSHLVSVIALKNPSDPKNMAYSHLVTGVVGVAGIAVICSHKLHAGLFEPLG